MTNIDELDDILINIDIKISDLYTEPLKNTLQLIECVENIYKQIREARKILIVIREELNDQKSKRNIFRSIGI